MRRIIYDGDSFYELDEDCVKKQKEREKKGSRTRSQPRVRQRKAGADSTGSRRFRRKRRDPI